MYGGREADLEYLKSVSNDYSIPYATRKVAYRKFQNILRQVQDKELNEMRLRLIRATKARDAEFVENMTEKIRVYSRKKGYVRH